MAENAPAVEYQERTVARRHAWRRAVLAALGLAVGIILILAAEFVPTPRLHERLARLWRLRHAVPEEPIWRRSIEATSLRSKTLPGSRPASLAKLLPLRPGEAVLLVTEDDGTVHALTVEHKPDQSGHESLDTFRFRSYRLAKPSLWSSAGWGSANSVDEEHIHYRRLWVERLDVSAEGPHRWRVSLNDTQGDVAYVIVAHSENSSTLTISSGLSDRGD